MKSTHKKYGVTMIELIVAMVVVSIAFLSLIQVFVFVASNTTESDDYVIAAYLAQGKMEEYLAKGRKVENKVQFASPWPTPWPTFCHDANLRLINDNGYPSWVADDYFDYRGDYGIKVKDFKYKVEIDFIAKTSDPISFFTPGLPPRRQHEMRGLKVTVIKEDVAGNISLQKSFSCLYPSRLME